MATPLVETERFKESLARLDAELMAARALLEAQIARVWQTRHGCVERAGSTPRCSPGGAVARRSADARSPPCLCQWLAANARFPRQADIYDVMAQKFIYPIEDQKADIRPIWTGAPPPPVPPVEPEPVLKSRLQHVEPAPKLPRPGSLDRAPKPRRPRRVK
jgi:hypothetical protein